MIEKLKIYTKIWLDPPTAFSDLNGKEQKLLCKQKLGQINNLNHVQQKVEDIFEREEFKNMFEGLRISKMEPVKLRLKEGAPTSFKKGKATLSRACRSYENSN